MELPGDALRLIGKAGDWKTTKNFCQAHQYRRLCEGSFWKQKAIEEMGKEYFDDLYDDNFHNYLAARSRYLEKTGKYQKYSEELNEIAKELSKILHEMYPNSFKVLLIEDPVTESENLSLESTYLN